jgi:hypothetical protein
MCGTSHTEAWWAHHPTHITHGRLLCCYHTLVWRGHHTQQSLSRVAP